MLDPGTVNGPVLSSRESYSMPSFDDHSGRSLSDHIWQFVAAFSVSQFEHIRKHVLAQASPSQPF